MQYIMNISRNYKINCNHLPLDITYVNTMSYKVVWVQTNTLFVTSFIYFFLHWQICNYRAQTSMYMYCMHMCFSIPSDRNLRWRAISMCLSTSSQFPRRKRFILSGCNTLLLLKEKKNSVQRIKILSFSRFLITALRWCNIITFYFLESPNIRIKILRENYYFCHQFP